MTDKLFEFIISYIILIATVIIGMRVFLGSIWLVFYIDEIIKKKLPRYKKWSDESDNDL